MKVLDVILILLALGVGVGVLYLVFSSLSASGGGGVTSNLCLNVVKNYSHKFKKGEKHYLWSGTVVRANYCASSKVIRTVTENGVPCTILEDSGTLDNESYNVYWKVYIEPYGCTGYVAESQIFGGLVT